MRISIHVPGYVYDKRVERSGQDSLEKPIHDFFVLSALDGWQYEEGNMYDYIDMELVDQAVVGGTIRAAWIPARGLEIVTDYWAPDTLHPSYIDRLRDETRGQLSDGIGECGFDVSVGGRQLVLVADTNNKLEVEVMHDGKLVPMPSQIARAARDGNIPLLVKALASGEPIDSQLQGESALHLAITFGHVDAALLLISKGANPNLVVGDGDEAPLHLCALSNSLSDNDSATVAKALLKHGADPTVKSPTGDTASTYAENRKKIALLRVLREYRGHSAQDR